MPVPRRADAVVRHRPGRRSSTTASAAARAATRSRSCRRPRASTSSARSSCSPTATASSSRSRTRIPRRPSAASAARGCYELLERTAAFYERYPVGVQGGRARRASTCSAAGWPRTRCARSASATRRRRGTRCCSPRGGPASRPQELYDAGLAKRGKRRRAGSSTTSAGGSRSRWPTRAGASSGSARGRWATTRSPSTSTRPRASSSTSASMVYGARPRARRRGEGRLGHRRRGLHRRRRAAPGRAARTPSAIMGTSLTDEQVEALRRLAPVAHLALDADNAGQEAMLRAARVARARGPRAARRAAARRAGPGRPRRRARGPRRSRALLERSTAVRALPRAARSLGRATLERPRARTGVLEELRADVRAARRARDGGSCATSSCRSISDRIDLPGPTSTLLVQRLLARSPASAPRASAPPPAPRRRGRASPPDPPRDDRAPFEDPGSEWSADRRTPALAPARRAARPDLARDPGADRGGRAALPRVLPRAARPRRRRAGQHRSGRALHVRPHPPRGRRTCASTCTAPRDAPARGRPRARRAHHRARRPRGRASPRRRRRSTAQRLQLELRRLDRRMNEARAPAEAGGVTELARARDAVKAEFDLAMERANATD